MNKIIISLLTISISVLNAQTNILVNKGNKPYITVEDFKNKFGHTLEKDKTKSKEEVLNYYIKTKLKSDDARKLDLDKKLTFIKPMNMFIDKRQSFYLEEDEFYKKMKNQFIDRSSNEVQLTQYLIEGITREQADKYQNEFKSNIDLFIDLPNVKVFDNKFYRVGELPYILEEEIYSDFREGVVLGFKQLSSNSFIFTKISQIRKFSGNYTVKLLLLKEDNAENKKKINELYGKILNGQSFSELVKRYSQNVKSKKNPITIPTTIIPEEILPIFKNLNKGEISKPFITEYGWIIIKLLDFNLNLDDSKVLYMFKNSDEYNSVLKKYKINFIDDKLNPKYNNVDLISDLDNQKIVNLFDSSSKSEEEFNQRIAEIVKNVIKKESIVEFNNGLKYTNWNFILENSNRIRYFKQNNMTIDDKIEELLQRSINNVKINLFDTSMDQYNPEFKKEVELMEANLLNQEYDRYIYKKAIKDRKGLKNEYNLIKSDYKWGKRAEVIIAYCGSNKELADKIEKELKNNNSIKKLQQQFIYDDVYFRQIKREFNHNDLPKGYSKNKKLKIYNDNNDYYVTKTITIIPEQNPTYEEIRPVVEKIYKEKYLKKSISDLEKDISINKSVLNDL